MKSLLLLLLLPTLVFGQIQSSAETKYILSGIENYEVVADMLLVPETSKPVLKAVGLVKVDVPASMISVTASTEKRVPVEVKKLTGDQFLVLGSGKIWIDVTAIDFDTKFFEQSQFTIVIGNNPLPPEPDEPDEPDAPSPDIPEDKFDNIAQRVALWSSGLPDKKTLASIYLTAATKLRNEAAHTIDSVVVELTSEIQLLPSASNYTELRQRVNADLTARTPISRMAYAEYLTLVALGLTHE